MTNMNIYSVTRPYLNYKCEDPILVSNQGVVNIALKSEVEKLEDIYQVIFEFKMRILTLDDDEEFDEEENFAEKEAIALFHVKYKVVMESDLELEEITEGKMLRLLESYIRKDTNDFYREVEMPSIQLPPQLWKKE